MNAAWMHEDDDDEQPSLLRGTFGADDDSLPLHDGMPIRGYDGGQPIPDLGRLPRQQWSDALRPLGARAREAAKNTLHTQAEVVEASIVIGELLVEELAAGARATDAPPPRVPAGVVPRPSPASRQVNFRLGPREHEQLVEAARLFGMRPTSLARVLTVQGVDRALYEERRDRRPRGEQAP